MEQKQIKICGYEATYRESENIAIIEIEKGKVYWDKTPDQTDYKPTNQIGSIIAEKENIKETFLKETHIMVTLKKAMDWVQNSSNEQTLKQEETKAPEATQEVTEPIKEEQEQEKEPAPTGEQQETETKPVDVPRNPDGTIQKGHSLNPAGRKKGSKNKFLTETLIKELRKEYGRITKADGTVEVITQFEQMIREGIKRGTKGDVKFFNSIFDRVEGKPKEDLTINKPEHRDLEDDEREELDKKLGL